MSSLPIFFTFFLIIFHPIFSQIRTYIKIEKVICHFPVDYFLENTSCTTLSIDRETVVINAYGMTRKAVNDVSVRQSFNYLINFYDLSQIGSLHKQPQRLGHLQARKH